MSTLTPGTEIPDDDLPGSPVIRTAIVDTSVYIAREQGRPRLTDAPAQPGGLGDHRRGVDRWPPQRP